MWIYLRNTATCFNMCEKFIVHYELIILFSWRILVSKKPQIFHWFKKLHCNTVWNFLTLNKFEQTRNLGHFLCILSIILTSSVHMQTYVTDLIVGRQVSSLLGFRLILSFSFFYVARIRVQQHNGCYHPKFISNGRKKFRVYLRKNTYFIFKMFAISKRNISRKM